MASTKRPSPFRRLSRFLPQLNTETVLQDAPPPPLPPKNVLSSHTEIRNPRRSHNVSSRPSSPHLNEPFDDPPLQVNKIRNHVSPSLLTPTSNTTSANTCSEERSITESSPLFSQPVTANTGQSLTPHMQSVPNSSLGDSERNFSSTKLKKSWLPGSRSCSTKNNVTNSIDEPQAWVNAGAAKIQYDLQPLLQGDRVSEIWNNVGETFVYLCSRESGRSAQFRVPYTVIESSTRLRNLIRDSELFCQGKCNGTPNLTNQEIVTPLESGVIKSRPSTRQQSLSDEISESDSFDNPSDKAHLYHLYLPLESNSSGTLSAKLDPQKMVDIRNLFALLTSQPLVATSSCPTYFKIFLSVATLLRDFEFSSQDGNSFGTAVDSAFSFCLKEIPQIVDCRESKQVTIEALILAEAMKSTELYNEAFAHAVGKYDALTSYKPKSIFNLVSSLTRNRLEKASRDLKQRIRSVNDRLSDFEFPSLFAGIAASTSMEEAKLVRFKQWKLSFLSFRKQVISYYKELHGQWPPKASSKKNNFIECGLNRLVLKGFYNDLCDLYDFLVDRESLTTRVYNGDGMEEAASVTSAARALRKLLDEYDRSSPPVQPPIPFDIPLIPVIRSIDPTFQNSGPADQHKKMNQRLNENEAALILTKSHNLDSDYKSPFVEMFKLFELKEAKGRTSFELSEQRFGHWIFLYACLQSLPLLVTDAPDLQYVDGVEYFLCQVPLGNLPWVEDQSQVKMSWFEVKGGQQIVSLPSDVVNHGVEATCSRSHCWVVAEKWIEAEQNSNSSDSPNVVHFSPLSPPPGFERGGFGLPNSENQRRSSFETASQCSSQISSSSRGHVRGRSRPFQRSSIALGLEKIHIESDGYRPNSLISRGVSPISLNQNTQSGPNSRTQSQCGESRRAFSSSTFDDILSSISTNKNIMGSKDNSKEKGKEKKKKKKDRQKNIVCSEIMIE